MTQQRVTELGGPSTETLRLIEGAKQGGFSHSTLRKVDKGLGWPLGTALRFFKGEVSPAEKEQLLDSPFVDEHGNQTIYVRGAAGAAEALGPAPASPAGTAAALGVPAHAGRAALDLGGLTLSAGGGGFTPKRTGGPSVAELLERAEHGDPEAVRTVQEAGREIAEIFRSAEPAMVAQIFRSGEPADAAADLLAALARLGRFDRLDPAEEELIGALGRALPALRRRVSASTSDTSAG